MTQNQPVDFTGDKRRKVTGIVGMPDMNDKQTRETRGLAWFVLLFFVCTAAFFSYFLYDVYSTEGRLRSDRLSIHYKHVREIQSLEPTSGNIASAATKYLHLGVGAMTMIDRGTDLILWSSLAVVAISVCGILVPIRVLRYLKSPSRMDEQK